MRSNLRFGDLPHEMGAGCWQRRVGDDETWEEEKDVCVAELQAVLTAAARHYAQEEAVSGPGTGRRRKHWRGSSSCSEGNIQIPSSPSVSPAPSPATSAPSATAATALSPASARRWSASRCPSPLPKRPPPPPPDVIKRVISRLKAAAFAHAGNSTICSSFLKRMDKFSVGTVSMDDWLLALRRDFNFSLVEVPDQHARQIFAELIGGGPEDATAEGGGVVDVRVFASLVQAVFYTDQSGLAPELLMRLLTRLKAAAYKEDGIRLEASFFQRLDPRGAGRIDGQEWVTAVRADLGIGQQELTDSQALSLLRFLDTACSSFVQMTEILGLANDAHAGAEGRAAHSNLPMDLVGKVVARLKASAYLPTEYRVDGRFVQRVDRRCLGGLVRDDWKTFLRKELKLSPTDVTDEHIKRLFDEFESDGVIDVEDLFTLARDFEAVANQTLAALLMDVDRAKIGLRLIGMSRGGTLKAGLRREASPPQRFVALPAATRVKVVGLTVRPDLNGLEGSVSEFDFKRFRYNVDVRMREGVVKRMAFAPKCLRTLDGASAIPTAVPSPRTVDGGIVASSMAMSSPRSLNVRGLNSPGSTPREESPVP